MSNTTPNTPNLPEKGSADKQKRKDLATLLKNTDYTLEDCIEMLRVVLTTDELKNLGEKKLDEEAAKLGNLLYHLKAGKSVKASFSSETGYPYVRSTRQVDSQAGSFSQDEYSMQVNSNTIGRILDILFTPLPTIYGENGTNTHRVGFEECISTAPIFKNFTGVKISTVSFIDKMDKSRSNPKKGQLQVIDLVFDGDTSKRPYHPDYLFTPDDNPNNPNYGSTGNYN